MPHIRCNFSTRTRHTCQFPSTILRKQSRLAVPSLSRVSQFHLFYSTSVIPVTGGATRSVSLNIHNHKWGIANGAENTVVDKRERATENTVLSLRMTIGARLVVVEKPSTEYPEEGQ